MKHNDVENINEYKSRKISLTTNPQIIFIELTRNCNLNCGMCERAKKYGDKIDPKLNMRWKVFERIEKELFATAKIIDLHGNGETLCYPYFLEVLERCSLYKKKIRIVTNLNISNNKILDQIVNKNVDLCVSCDSPDQMEYEQIRKNASFNLLCNNLEYLCLKKYSNIKVFMTLDINNITKLTSMIDFISKYSIKKLYVWNRFLDKNDKNALKKEELDNEKIFYDVFQYAKKVGVEIRVLTWPKFNCNAYHQNVCIKPWMSVHINYDGSIGMCDFNETPQGMSKLNIENMDFNEIWNSDIYLDIRNRMLNNRYVEFCSDCCIGNRFVDFEDEILVDLKSSVISNFQNSKILLGD